MSKMITLEEVKEVLSQIIQSNESTTRDRLSAIDRLARIEQWFLTKGQFNEYEQLELQFEEDLTVDKLSHFEHYFQQGDTCES